MMQPRFENLSSKVLVGKSLVMSLTDNKSELLWNSFIPMLKDLKNIVSTNKFSLQIYPSNYFNNFNPSIEFTKWALIEVADFEELPLGFEKFELIGGQYAVFIHKGDTSEFYKTSNYIYSNWLPNSEYVLDDRPHFEILSEKTKKNDPNSEEEIWIPIRLNI